MENILRTETLLKDGYGKDQFVVPSPTRESLTEIEHTVPSISIYYIRHGKQEAYGNPNAYLTSEGREQVHDFIWPLIPSELEKYKQFSTEISLYSSSRVRTQESMQIIDGVLHTWFQGSDTVSVADFKTRESLQTADVLYTVMNNKETLGISDNSQAFHRWLQSTPEEMSSIGTLTPEELGIHLFEDLKHMINDSLTENSDRKKVTMCITHENSLAALLSLFQDKSEIPAIPYLDYLRFDVIGDRVELIHRNQLIAALPLSLVTNDSPEVIQLQDN